jgi:hypothetical protein
MSICLQASKLRSAASSPRDQQEVGSKNSQRRFEGACDVPERLPLDWMLGCLDKIVSHLLDESRGSLEGMHDLGAEGLSSHAPVRKVLAVGQQKVVAAVSGARQGLCDDLVALQGIRGPRDHLGGHKSRILEIVLGCVSCLG